MKIISDTASLFSPKEGQEMGVTIVPACVLNDGEVYRDYEDITGEGFLQLVQNGAALTSSQPAIGDLIDAVIHELLKSIESSVSFVIPADFEYLKRSGRLTAIAAKISSMIKIVPVLTQTEDMKRITPMAVKRSWKKAVEAIVERLKKLGINESYRIYVCHAGDLKAAAGHCFPLFAKFKGGKAVATMYGFLFGMSVVGGYSIWIFFVPLIAFLIVLYIGKIIALASIASAVVNTIFIFAVIKSMPLFAASLIFTAVIIIRHKKNLERIVKGVENKISWM